MKHLKTSNLDSSQSVSAPANVPSDGRVRSDTGTIVLHWLTAAAFLVSLFTGLRIAGDAPTAWFSRWLSPVLPQGEIWTWHFISGLVLAFCMSAYTVYIRRARLAQRNTLTKLKLLSMPNVPSRQRWGAINIGLHWFVYGLIGVLTITGAVLYYGKGGLWVTVHSVAAFIGLAYVAIHVIAHAFYGGLAQLLRLFRPAPLVSKGMAASRPLVIAAALGGATAAAVAMADWSTRDTLTVGKVSVAPALDGKLDEAAWANARRITIHTQQGLNLGGSGESTVTARAVRDDSHIYFAFEWTDPSRSLRRVPLIKRQDGWYTLDEGNDRADVNKFYEDKFSVAFSDKASLGGAGSTGFGPAPLSGQPATLHGRGFHYTTDGSTLDMWQWKASRGGMIGRVDDQYFGPVRTATEAERTGNARYQGGYWNDPGKAFYSYNNNFERKGERKPVTLRRLPKDWQAQVAAMGKYDLDPDSSDAENGRWFMTEAETEPYTAAADAAIPVGTVLPGVLIMGDYEGDRADVTGAAHWQNGMWRLETKRKLKTSSAFDKDFEPGRDLYMWVAVFDHTQTRHSRHARPVRVTLTP